MNNPVQTLIRCGAKTRSGAPCAKFPMEGKRRCRLHGGLSTGPKTPAANRYLGCEHKHGRYKNWREKQAESGITSEIKRVMQEAVAGLLVGKCQCASPRPFNLGCHPVSQTLK